jgi:hypothetical protein
MSCSFLSSPQSKRVTPAPKRKELQLNIPKATWEPIFFRAIDERAKRSRLETLRSAAFPGDDFEVRVWHGFGLTLLEGFVLKRAGAQWSAIHLRGITRNMPSQEFQQTLQPPRSGWDKSWQRLQDAGILSLPDAFAIGCSPMDVDGMSYVVEYNRDGIYRTYMYDNPENAKCDEAKRMIEIGNMIAEEFNLLIMRTN